MGCSRGCHAPATLTKDNRVRFANHWEKVRHVCLLTSSLIASYVTPKLPPPSLHRYSNTRSSSNQQCRQPQPKPTKTPGVSVACCALCWLSHGQTCCCCLDLSQTRCVTCLTTAKHLLLPQCKVWRVVVLFEQVAEWGCNIEIQCA